MLSRLRLMLFVVLVGSVSAADSPQGPQPLGVTKKSKSTDASKPKSLQPSARLNQFTGWVTSLAFSPDDKTLAVGVKDAVQLVDLETKSVHRDLPVKSGQIRAMSYSPDGKLLLTGGYQRLSVWNAETGELVRELKGHRGYVTGVAYSPNGQRIATSCEDETVRIWTPGQDDPLVLRGHGYPMTGVAWSPDGSLLAASAGDDTRPTKPGQVVIWDAATGVEKSLTELHSKAATGVAFSPDGKYLASTSYDEHVNVFDVTANRPLGFFGGHSRPTNGVLFHPDGETAISISGGRAVGKNELKVWEFESGDELATVEGHEGRISALALSHDGRLIATGGYDKTVALWNVGFLAIGLPTVAAKDAKPDAAVPLTADLPPADAQTVLTEKAATAEVKMLRAGIIGLDTSHVIAFTKTLNAPQPNPAVAGCRVVAAYPKGSPDIASSISRVPGYIEELKKYDVEIVDSIEELVKRVDVVMLETNDGRPHYEQILPVLKAGKPCFIDKPIAGTLSDAIAIFEAARKYNVPIFSSSSLRFGKTTQAVRSGSVGRVTRCVTTSPASLEPTHPDLFWYGIHGVESLFTVMGTGCESVARGKTSDGKIEVVGHWSGDRVGTYQEGKGYTGTATGDKGESPVGSYDGYDPLVFEIVKFFRSGQPPVGEKETLEIYSFMEAADESKRQGGAKVTLESVFAKAREEARQKTAELK